MFARGGAKIVVTPLLRAGDVDAGIIRLRADGGSTETY